MGHFISKFIIGMHIFLPVPLAVVHRVIFPSLPLTPEIAAEGEHDNVYHLRVT